MGIGHAESRSQHDCPTKVLDVTEDQPFSIQLRFAHLSPKNYGELRQNQYAHQQAAILHELFIDSFGGGIR